ncbi:MAG: type II toxin-antitoxin system RelE/ParE family toxin [Magnetococcales bacterium]|nr:type II toxin-antitoxin system RelE/ParE family toxin [Magnetococcales bacterium]
MGGSSVGYQVEYSNGARKCLKSLPAGVRTMIMNKISGLAENPRATNPNVKKLVGCPEYRLRVGDWRVIYALHHKVLIVEVLKIGSRGGIYS